MENNLQDLENAIYNSIPRLRELSVGCQVDFKDAKYPMTLFSKANGLLRFIDKNGTSYAWPEEETKGFMKIIGHPILLNDVLEWLRLIDKDKDYYSIDYFGNLLKFNYDSEYICWEKTKMNWNLSKPALKDQSQELIDALTELIPK